MSSYTFKDSAGTTRYRDAAGAGTVDDPYRNRDVLVHPTTGAPLIGRAAAAAALPVALSSEDLAVLSAILTALASAGGLTDAQLRAAAVAVSAASLPLPAGAATQTTLAAILAALASVAVTGSVAVTNLPGTQPISAASLPLPAGAATQTTLAAILAALASVAVTGPLTDTQLRATALPVSGTFWQATQPVSAAALPLPAGAATEASLAGGVGLRVDLDGTSQSGLWTLSATPGTVTSIALPDAARIVTLKPSADIQLRLNADPAAIGSGAFAAGSPVAALERRAFILASGASRTLRLRSATASATVTVEWRP
jgi:hypothetical protein